MWDRFIWKWLGIKVLILGWGSSEKSKRKKESYLKSNHRIFGGQVSSEENIYIEDHIMGIDVKASRLESLPRMGLKIMIWIGLFVLNGVSFRRKGG